ncbi:unnamed protein product, partial [Pylaiella littoralis]
HNFYNFCAYLFTYSTDMRALYCIFVYSPPRKMYSVCRSIPYVDRLPLPVCTSLLRPHISYVHTERCRATLIKMEHAHTRTISHLYVSIVHSHCRNSYFLLL